MGWWCYVDVDVIRLRIGLIFSIRISIVAVAAVTTAFSAAAAAVMLLSHLLLLCLQIIITTMLISLVNSFPIGPMYITYV